MYKKKKYHYRKKGASTDPLPKTDSNSNIVGADRREENESTQYGVTSDGHYSKYGSQRSHPKRRQSKKHSGDYSNSYNSYYYSNDSSMSSNYYESNYSHNKPNSRSNNRSNNRTNNRTNNRSNNRANNRVNSKGNYKTKNKTNNRVNKWAKNDKTNEMTQDIRSRQNGNWSYNNNINKTEYYEDNTYDYWNDNLSESLKFDQNNCNNNNNNNNNSMNNDTNSGTNNDTQLTDYNKYQNYVNYPNYHKHNTKYKNNNNNNNNSNNNKHDTRNRNNISNRNYRKQYTEYSTSTNTNKYNGNRGNYNGSAEATKSSQLYDESYESYKSDKQAKGSKSGGYVSNWDNLNDYNNYSSYNDATKETATMGNDSNMYKGQAKQVHQQSRRGQQKSGLYGNTRSRGNRYNSRFDRNLLHTNTNDINDIYNTNYYEATRKQDYDNTRYMDDWLYNSKNNTNGTETNTITPKSTNATNSDNKENNGNEDNNDKTDNMRISDDLRYESIRLFMQFFECNKHSDYVLTSAMNQLQIICKNLPQRDKFDLFGLKPCKDDFSQYFYNNTQINQAKHYPKTMKYLQNKFHQRTLGVFARNLNDSDSKDNIFEISEDTPNTSDFSPLMTAVRRITEVSNANHRRKFRNSKLAYGNINDEFETTLSIEHQLDIWYRIILFLVNTDLDMKNGGNCSFFRCVCCKQVFDVYSMYHKCSSAPTILKLKQLKAQTTHMETQTHVQHNCPIKVLISSILRISNHGNNKRNRLILNKCYDLVSVALSCNNDHNTKLPIGKIEIKEHYHRHGDYFGGVALSLTNKFHTILRTVPNYDVLRNLLSHGCVPFSYIKFDDGSGTYRELTDSEIDGFCSKVPGFWSNIPVDWGMVLLNVYHDIYAEKVYRELWKLYSDLSVDIIELILEFVWNSDYEKHFPPAYTFDLKNVENCLQLLKEKEEHFNQRYSFTIAKKESNAKNNTYQSWLQYFDKKRKYRKLRKDEKHRKMIEQWKGETVKCNNNENGSNEENGVKDSNDVTESLKNDSTIDLVSQLMGYESDEELQKQLIAMSLQALSPMDDYAYNLNDMDGSESFGVLSP